MQPREPQRVQERNRDRESKRDTCTMIQRQSLRAPNGTGGGRPQGQTARDYRTSLLIFLAQLSSFFSPRSFLSSDTGKCSGKNLEGYRPPPSRSTATGEGLAESHNFHRVLKLISEKTKEKNKAE